LGPTDLLDRVTREFREGERVPELSRRAKAGLFGLVVCTCLLLGEGIARLGVSEEPLYIVPHPYLRWVRAPGLDLPLRSPLDGRSYTLRVDDEGFRSRLEGPLQPGRAEDRIFFVGGSTTENRVLPDEDTFPYRVEEALLGEGRSVRVFNTALNGGMIADSFSLIAHRLLALDPDVIVVMHAINDMRAGLSSRFDPSHYEDRRPPRPARPGDVFQRYSRLYQLIIKTRKRLKTRTGLDGERYLERAQSTPYTTGVDPSRGLPYFRRYLGMIASVCADAGVPLVLMTQPSLYKPVMEPSERDTLWMGWLDHGDLNLDPPTLLRGMQAYNREIRRFASERDLTLIDLDAAVPKDLEHFYDDCHFTALGNRVVAETILAGLPRPALR
jgi:lysophospholipase L1-like esterase